MDITSIAVFSGKGWGQHTLRSCKRVKVDVEMFLYNYIFDGNVSDSDIKNNYLFFISVRT